MTVFVIHHFEEMWSSGLRKYGTDMAAELAKIINFIENNEGEIDQVIMSVFEHGGIEDHQAEIEEFCRSAGIPFARYEYGYGWTKDQYEFEPELISEENRGITWCDATRPCYAEEDGHILEIDEWQRQLKGKNVWLAGAFAEECLDDMHTVLQTVGADVTYVEGLCVGMDGEYEFSFGGTSKRHAEYPCP